MSINNEKIQACVRLAREASRNSWKCTDLKIETRETLHQVSRQAIADARHWKVIELTRFSNWHHAA